MTFSTADQFSKRMCNGLNNHSILCHINHNEIRMYDLKTKWEESCLREPDM